MEREGMKLLYALITAALAIFIVYGGMVYGFFLMGAV